MKFEIKVGITLICIILLTGLYIINDKYSEFKERKCIVIDKIQTSGGYKTSGEFYMILREVSTNRTFDLIVSPSTYVTTKPGDIIYFNLREFDIRQDKWNTIKSIAAFTLFWTAILVSIIFTIAYFTDTLAYLQTF